MSTANEKTYDWYIGNDSTTVFPITFDYGSREDIAVYLLKSGGEQVKLTDKQFSFQDDKNIIYPTDGSDKLQAEDVLVINRETILGSDYEFDNQRRLFPEEVMNADDLSFRQIQDLASTLNRAVKIPITSDRDPDDALKEIEDGLLTIDKKVQEVVDLANQTSLESATVSEIYDEIKDIGVENFALKSDIPTRLGQLENDAGYLTANDVPTTREATEDTIGVIRIATESEALEGFDNNTAMTPLKTSKVVYDNIGRVVQLSFDGVLEDNVITFKPTEGEPYDIRQGYEYEIDLLLEAVGDIDNPSMIILNGEKAITILNAIHTDSSALLNANDMSQVVTYDTDTGFRWIFRAKYVELADGHKVFYMERPVARFVTEVNAMSTDAEAPSAKLFYDTVGNLEDLINAL